MLCDGGVKYGIRSLTLFPSAHSVAGLCEAGSDGQDPSDAQRGVTDPTYNRRLIL